MLHVFHTKWYHPNGVMIFTSNLMENMTEMGIKYKEHEGWRTSPDYGHFGTVSMTASAFVLRTLRHLRKPSLSTMLEVPGTMQYVVDLMAPDGRSQTAGEGLMRRMMKSAIAGSDCYLTNTNLIADRLRSEQNTGNKKITVVPVPIDPVFKPGTYVRKGNLTFLTIGKLTKRREGLLSMPLVIREAFPEERIEIVTVGPRCESLDRLSTNCAANAITHTSLPPLPNRSLPLHYQGADCYLYMSSFEGYSMTPREALGCGTPCLISHNEVHDEVYAGKKGITFYDGPESIRKAVEMGHSPAYSEWARSDTWRDVTRRVLKALELA